MHYNGSVVYIWSVWRIVIALFRRFRAFKRTHFSVKCVRGHNEALQCSTLALLKRTEWNPKTFARFELLHKSHRAYEENHLFSFLIYLKIRLLGNNNASWTCYLKRTAVLRRWGYSTADPMGSKPCLNTRRFCANGEFWDKWNGKQQGFSYALSHRYLSINPYKYVIFPNCWRDVHFVLLRVSRSKPLDDTLSVDFMV